MSNLTQSRYLICPQCWQRTTEEASWLEPIDFEQRGRIGISILSCPNCGAYFERRIKYDTSESYTGVVGDLVLVKRNKDREREVKIKREK